MQPWMMIAFLMVACAALLVGAPRLHRRSLERARERRERLRLSRIQALRDRPGTVEVAVPNRSVAIRARDLLLLRGVRVEIAAAVEGVVVVHAAGDEQAVLDALEAAIDTEGSE